MTDYRGIHTGSLLLRRWRDSDRVIVTGVPGRTFAEVAVLMDVADMDAVTALMQSEAGAEAMAYDGVLADTMVILVES